LKLIIFNGSPRGKNGNTEIILRAFLEGFTSVSSNEYEIFYIYNIKNKKLLLNSFKNSEHCIIAFPLYFDAMPSGVKAFVEELSILRDKKNKFSKNRSIGYIIQSGFPEAHHSRFVERYFQKFTLKIGAKYLGTIVKGGGILLEIKPLEFMLNKKVLEYFKEAGIIYGKTGSFDKNLLKKISSPERLPFIMELLVKLFTLLKIEFIDDFWNNRLKKNNAYGKRFAKPYID